MLKKLLIFLLLVLICPLNIFAQNTTELENKVKEYEAEINRLEKEKDTLSNQIKIIDSQINLNTTKINQTENEIKTLEEEIQRLAVQIGELDINLNQLTTIFIQQINQNYRLLKQGPPIAFILFNDFNSFLQQKKYVTTLQKNSQETILKMEITRTNYDQQKTQKEQKQQELEALQKKLADQKRNLDNQKISKKNLLEITKNSEANYQKLLSQVRAELAAIEGILAGRGDETKVGVVEAGAKIASVIQGSSCNSSGTHLHFMVEKDNASQNPFNYLKSIDYFNDSGGDPFNPTGSWNWPLNPKIDFNQGYGQTWAVRNTWVKRIYTFHNGIDISGSDTTVFATHRGILYRGSFKGACTLKYVRVQEENSNLSTYYLHVNYY